MNPDLRSTETPKIIHRVLKNPNQHWVGDGFPVTTLFSYSAQGQAISPFLLLDYAGPATFEPSDTPRGVEEHPHRGFETVTLVYAGEVEHRDNAGNSGKIGPGDVQWMTAGRGILHTERHGRDFTQTGGTLEMVQLWVNLPAKDKMTEPAYQDLLRADIPVLPLEKNMGHVRVIAGQYNATHGPARTFTPINIWDVHLNNGAATPLYLPDTSTTMILVRTGQVRVNGTHTLIPRDLALFSRDGTTIHLDAPDGADILVLNGAAIDEPIVGRGPFVMNTQAEIEQAFADFRAGKF